MPIDNSESMTSLFMIGLFESAMNTVLAQHAQAAQTLASHAGKVIRIKIFNPHYSIYLVLCEEGVQILSQFDGVVDARVRAPASQLAWLMLGESADSQQVLNQLKVTGNQQLVADLVQLTVEINLWHWMTSLLQEWLPDFRNILRQLAALRSHSTEWIENIQQLSKVNCETLDEIRRQGQAQQALLNELINMRQWMEKKSARHSMILWLVLGCLVIWFGLIK